MVGKLPPVWHDSSRVVGSTNDAAKDEAQATLNLRVQRRSHASATWWAKKQGFACFCLRQLPNELHGFLAPPPASVNCHHSGYVVSLSILAWANTAPSMSAARGLGSPELPNALRTVMSTASWVPPKHGKSWAKTSMRRSSSGRT